MGAVDSPGPNGCQYDAEEPRGGLGRYRLYDPHLTSKIATQNSQWKVLEWMSGEGYSLPVWPLLKLGIDARQTGPVNYLLSELECSEEFINDAMRHAIRAGNINMVEVIHEAVGGPRNEYRGLGFAGNTWLYECPLAASLGNLPLLKWLKEHGYYFWQSKKAARLAGFPEVAAWAKANGATGDD